MLHKVEQETRQQIEALIADLLPEEQARIRIIPVSNGNRSTPLNVAIEAANGHYFAVLDDDDLVMGDWIEAFENGASLHPGFIIHSNCISQMWSKPAKVIFALKAPIIRIIAPTSVGRSNSTIIIARL